jgi:hypothetical protein
MSQQEETVENIFSDSLELLVGRELSETSDDGQLVFGPLRLTVAPKVPYARLGLPCPARSEVKLTLRLCRKEGKVPVALR